MQSESINELASALCKAQMEIEGAVKDSANPFYKSKYADLHTCWQSCRDQLTKNGLSIVQTNDDTDTCSFLVTTLMHTSGQWIKSKMQIPKVKPGAQEFGSAMTYCRRYALSAMVGLSQYDDDGEEAQKEHRLEKKKQEIKPDTDKMTLHKKICATGNVVPIETLTKFLDYMSTKFSTPVKPYTVEHCIENALSSTEKLESFTDKLLEWSAKA